MEVKCKHDFQQRAPKTIMHEHCMETLQFRGQECTKCKRPRGSDKGLDRHEYRFKNAPRGQVPDSYIRHLSNGQWRPRWPKSRNLVDEVRRLALEGVFEADISIHAKNGKPAVTWIHAPTAAAEDQLAMLRREVTSQRPNAHAWAAKATLRDLQLANRILAHPSAYQVEWPTRVWNAAFNDHSKAGDAARVAQALGCRVRNRASIHAIWFYGHGIIQTKSRVLKVEDELVVPSAWLEGDLHFPDQTELAIVENRDLASIMPGFTLALDGQCSPTHLHVIQQASRAGLKTWAWPDVDGAGITMARNIKAASPATRIRGLQEWPTAWARVQEPAQKAQIAYAQRIQDEYSPLLDWILQNGWIEQERVFAELQGIPD